MSIERHVWVKIDGKFKPAKLVLIGKTKCVFKIRGKRKIIKNPELCWYNPNY